MRRALIFITSWYNPRLPLQLVYMLQQVEYRPGPFMSWLAHDLRNMVDIRRVMQRKSLNMTRRARVLVVFGYGIIGLWVLLITCLALRYGTSWLAALVIAPQIALLALVVAVVLGYVFIAKPAEKRLVNRASAILATHQGMKIAVAGSYGKTTMKELLSTVLGSRLNVAATTGNGNTPIAHARFIDSLQGDEDVLIFEFGEGAPGDVEEFCRTIQPDMAIITGLAPNHLDRYKTVDALAADVLSLRDSVTPDKLYLAGDSELLTQYAGGNEQVYSVSGGPDWRVSDVNVSADKLEFTYAAGSQILQLQSSLLGKHQVAPLGLVVRLALQMGLKPTEVEKAIGATKPYAHRMQPYQLHGATIIDDTYNGNLEGMLAGLTLLDELEATRKIYVTPGLVDQGEETVRVHRRIALEIVRTKPDILVLMQNSATAIILDELHEQKYPGEIREEAEPLAFYQSLDQFVRAGDVVLMQNDWTDNYK